MRGEVTLPETIYGGTGITPACAGRSAYTELRKVSDEDHPRVCGEKAVQRGCPPPCGGSPPRVRGEGSGDRVHDAGHRITPACAGRRLSPTDSSAKAEDHPRVCGEKCSPLKQAGSRAGSPPRVRGEVALLRALLLRRGITPACAGRSYTSCSCNRSIQDHPRVRGEKKQPAATLPPHPGSPPRARGEAAVCL